MLESDLSMISNKEFANNGEQHWEYHKLLEIRFKNKMKNEILMNYKKTLFWKKNWFRKFYLQ